MAVAHDWREELAQDLLNLVQLSGEEVVSALDPVNLFGLGKRVIKLGNLGDGAKFITGSLENQFRLAGIAEKIKADRANGNSQAHQSRNARVGGSHRKAHPRPKRESHKANRQSGEMHGQVVERGANILLFAVAASESAHALARATEIETQGGKAHEECSLGGTKYHLVVHRAAIQRVRMANQRHVGGSDLRVPFD